MLQDYQPYIPTPVGIDSRQLEMGLIREVELYFPAALVIASNTTPLLLVNNSDTSLALVYWGGYVQLTGGTANYDQNQNFTVNYNTAGDGATVSTTLANFCNAGAAGKISTLKPIVTDYAIAAGKPIVLKSSASPKNAAGDRNLKVTCFYSVAEIE